MMKILQFKNEINRRRKQRDKNTHQKNITIEKMSKHIIMKMFKFNEAITSTNQEHTQKKDTNFQKNTCDKTSKGYKS